MRTYLRAIRQTRLRFHGRLPCIPSAKLDGKASSWFLCWVSNVGRRIDLGSNGQCIRQGRHAGVLSASNSVGAGLELSGGNCAHQEQNSRPTRNRRGARSEFGRSHDRGVRPDGSKEFWRRQTNPTQRRRPLRGSPTKPAHCLIVLASNHWWRLTVCARLGSSPLEGSSALTTSPHQSLNEEFQPVASENGAVDAEGIGGGFAAVVPRSRGWDRRLQLRNYWNGRTTQTFPRTLS